ncbi:hypothetical protein WA026_020727 [Henosepilachna vigintioctopunctata]|uniref:Uncharacterized protein n=1 Tax=Henosepilachna vigintioctopunctata TaxID=420089 RepID=A0AAW1UAZ1_9CUCU
MLERDKRDSIKKFDNDLMKMNPTNDQLFNDNTRWFSNISNTTNPTAVSDFLSLGPKLALKCKKNSTIKFERLLADIESIISETPEERSDSLRARATNEPRDIFTNFLNISESEQHSRMDEVFKKTESFPKTHPKLLVSQADKGICTVVMNIDEYYENTEELLRDTTTQKTEK